MRHGVGRLGFLVSAILFLNLLSVTVHAEETLSGKVLLPDGQPAAGARVRLYYCHEFSNFGSRWLAETEADEQGNFKIPMPDFERPQVILTFQPLMRCYLIAFHPDCSFGLAEVYRHQTNGYEIVLLKARTLRCTVVDREGHPVPDARITVLPVITLGVAPRGGRYDMSLPEPIQFPLADIYGATTDARGESILTSLPAVPLYVTAAHEEKGMGHAFADLGEAQAAITLGGKVWHVRGIVKYEDTGKPAEGMSVVALSWQAHFSYPSLTTAAADGRFELTAYLPEARTHVFREKGGPVLLVFDPSPTASYAPQWRILPIDGPTELELDLKLKRGALVAGRVRERITGKGLVAPLAADIHDPRGRWYLFSVYTLSGADGGYSVRLEAPGPPFDNGVATVGPCSDPPGFVTVWYAGTRNVPPGAPQVNVDFEMGIAPEASLHMAVRKPDGTAPSEAWVRAAQPGRWNLQAKVGADGRAILTGVAQGIALRLWVASTDGLFAAERTLPPLAQAVNEIELALRKTVPAQVVLLDEQQNPLPGVVSVWLPGEDGKPVVTVTERAAQGERNERLAVLGGILPGIEYVVGVSSDKGYTVAGGARWVRWRFDAEEQNPKLVIQMEKERVVFPPPPYPSEANFKRDLESLEEALWKKEDPVQKHLTWYALKQGLAFADTERKQVKRLQELLGEANFVATGMAFPQDKVWLATDRGLFAWDRKDQYWARFAVGGTILDSPIREISLGDDGKLHVTVEEAGKRPRRFEYDLAAIRWAEVR